MGISVRCPGWDNVLRVRDDKAGRVIRCPCGEKLPVPAGAPEKAPSLVARGFAEGRVQALAATSPAVDPHELLAFVSGGLVLSAGLLLAMPFSWPFFPVPAVLAAVLASYGLRRGHPFHGGVVVVLAAVVLCAGVSRAVAVGFKLGRLLR